MFKIRNSKILLVGIVLLALFWRFFRLSDFPVGVHGDEVSLAYNAYSLLKTARDENGVFLPIHSYISKTYRPVGYSYLDILPVKIFGLNAFAARFPGALFGSLTVLALYFLAREIFGSRQIALFSAFILAVNPWHINLSRASSESLVSLFFVVCGFYLFLRKNFWLAFLAFATSFLIYPAPRVFVPLLLVFVSPLLLKAKIFRKENFSPRLLIFVTAVSLFSLFLVFGTAGGAVKFADVGILNYQEAKARLIEAIGEDGPGTNLWLTRFFHNKPANFSAIFLENYFRYFTFDYLFRGVGFPMRYQITGTGLFLLPDLLLLAIGSYALVRKRRAIFLAPLFWLAAGPVAAALTWEDTPNVLRSLPLLPALVLISAFGLSQVYAYFKQQQKQLLFWLIAFSIFLCSFGHYLHQYYLHGRSHRPWYRDAGFQEMVLSVKALYKQYDRIIVTKTQPGPYIQFLFYLQFDPQTYQQSGHERDDDFRGFDKFVFVPHECPTPTEMVLKSGFPASLYQEKGLYVVGGNCKNQAMREIKVIERPDRTPVFRLWEQP